MFGGTESQVEEASSSPAVVVPPSVVEASSAGSGTTVLSAGAPACATVGLVCNAGDSCQCVKTTGTISDGTGSLFQGTFVFYLNIDNSPPATRNFPDGNNSGIGSCAFASGVLAITTTGTNTINFITAGAACNGISGLAGLYSGGVSIGPSTGGFSNATGSGMLGFGLNINTKVGIFDLKFAGAALN